MGQYYKPINIDNNQWLYSHEYDNGLKLMEHSWVGNNFVGTVMALMLPGGTWHKNRIVWAGDYYDGEGEIPYYSLAEDKDKINPHTSITKEMQKKAKLVNHTKKLYVRYDEMPCHTDDYGEWIVNPLPLLTALGNERGGGDYHSEHADFDKVGIWAGDVLSIEWAVPKSQWYKKFRVGFIEEI